MAKCSNCDSEISYLSYLLSGFTNFRVNLSRSKCNPVVKCKHCGCENVQESMFAIGGVLVMFAAGLLILLLARKIAHNNDSRLWFFYAPPSVFLAQYVWWKFFTKLREP